MKIGDFLKRNPGLFAPRGLLSHVCTRLTRSDGASFSPRHDQGFCRRGLQDSLGHLPCDVARKLSFALSHPSALAFGMRHGLIRLTLARDHSPRRNRESEYVVSGKHHSDQVAERKYQEAAHLLGTGKTIPIVCQELGISAATFHRWRRKFIRSVTVAESVPKALRGRDRVQRLEIENDRLKRLVAELMLENAFLKDALENGR